MKYETTKKLKPSNAFSLELNRLKKKLGKKAKKSLRIFSGMFGVKG